MTIYLLFLRHFILVIHLFDKIDKVKKTQFNKIILIDPGALSEIPVSVSFRR